MIKIQHAEFYSPFCDTFDEYFAIEVFENNGYRTGEVINNTYIVDNHTPLDKYVRAFHLSAINVIDSDDILDLEKCGFVEYKGLGELRYRYVRDEVFV
jgi:hypothetical protein